MRSRTLICWILFLLQGRASATGIGEVAVYLAAVDSNSALIAWGPMLSDSNSIGRTAVPAGKGLVRIDGREIAEEARSWVRVEDLEPDRDYGYEVLLNDRLLAKGLLRTWPRRAERLAFFVIGDYGRGNDQQSRLGKAMLRLLESSRGEGWQVRFVMTTGDNIYGRHFGILVRSSGNRDAHWRKRFFEPYRDLLLEIPFYPSPGNHDGGDSENGDDLEVYIDNFFLPPPIADEGSTPRYYSFRFADLAQFISLDSTHNAPPNGSAIHLPDGLQSSWLKKTLAEREAPAWRIPFYHHPIYTAGPKHGPAEDLGHWAEMFSQAGLRLVFNGHEHNLQFSAPQETGGIQYVVTGAGGSLRDGNIQHKLVASRIAAWAGEPHFLLVRLDRQQAEIQAYGEDARPLELRLRDGRRSSASWIVRRLP